MNDGHASEEAEGLELRDVACRRGGRTLFEGMTFALGRSDAALVTGPNGVGKSSLLRVAAGLLPPAAGTVRATASRALLDERAALDEDRTVAQALAFWTALDGRGDVPARVRVALEKTVLDHIADVPVRLLSTGQRRRAAMARLVAGGERLWLLDEPANGLDEGAARRLEWLIADHRRLGGVVVVASHLPIDLPRATVVTLA